MADGYMSNAEAIKACKEGRRVVTKTTLKGPFVHDPETCTHSWRTVACDSDTDVIECRMCGVQRTCACDFDEEYA